MTLLSQFEHYWSFLKLAPWDDKDVANFSGIQKLRKRRERKHHKYCKGISLGRRE